jgi:hypothetical protein
VDDQRRHLQANRDHWDARTPHHACSACYDVDGVVNMKPLSAVSPGGLFPELARLRLADLP